MFLYKNHEALIVSVSSSIAMGDMIYVMLLCGHLDISLTIKGVCHRAVTLVAWLILVSETKTTREVVSLLFPTLFLIPEEGKLGGNNKETGCLIQLATSTK